MRTIACVLLSALEFIFLSPAHAVQERIPATIQWDANRPECNIGYGFLFPTKEAALQCLIENSPERFEYSGELIPMGPAQPDTYRAPGMSWDNYPHSPAIWVPIAEISQVGVRPSCPPGSNYLDYYSTTPNAWTCNINVVRIEQSKKPCDICLSNPIQPGMGNKRQDDTDYSGSGPSPLTFRRTYNSLPQFGSTWTHNFDRYITDESVGAEYHATIHRAEGSYSFSWNGSVWVSDSDVNYKLQGSNGSYTVITPSGDREFYDSLNKVRYVTNMSASVIRYTFNYTGNPRLLTSVVNSFGHTLTFTYDTQNRLEKMIDPAGGEYLYAYDGAGNLMSVTYPDSKAKQYRYNESTYTSGANLPKALTGIVDEGSSRYANFGYTSGLATMSEHAGGVDRFSVTYGTPPMVLEAEYIDVPKSTKYVTRYYQPPSGVTATDAFGQVRHYGFTSINGAVKTTGSDAPCTGLCTNVPLSRVLDANGNVSTKTDFEGRVTNYAYDLSRNLETSRIEADGTDQARTITTQWNSTYRLPSRIDEPGLRTTFTHGANGDVLTRTALDTSTLESRTWTYTYNTYGQVLTANGPRTDVSDLTTYTYYNCSTGYQCGQINTITNALGQVTTYNTYNAHGQPLTITDPNGTVTTLTYDLRQRLLSRTVGMEQTSFEYWPTGLLKKATLPDGSYLEYTYDAAHRLTEINDAQGNRMVYTLDLMGNRTKEEAFDSSLALSRTRSQVFNTLNQLSQQIAASGSPSVTTTFGYDNNGNQTSISAPLGRNTTQSYDELNRLTSVADPESGLTQYGYNALDQLISVTDPRGLVTSYSYNALGDLKQQVSPDTGTTNNTYDSGGNLKTSTDARNAITTYTYDAINRIKTAAFKKGTTTDQTITYTYDAGTHGKGQLTSASDSSHSMSWVYDPQGRVTNKTQVLGTVSKSAAYGYTNGQLTSLTTPSGQLVNYAYSNGQVSGITVNGTQLLNTILYDPFGPARQWSWGNGTLSVRTFDQDGKLTQLDSAGLNTYSYDDAFRITGITDTANNNLSWTYGYDDLDRLTSASTPTQILGWSYDADGNRLTQSGTAQTLSYPATSNRLASITGTPARTYTYDAAGNITNNGSRTFAYNYRGRMKSTTSGSTTISYTYNALGQRIKKTGTVRLFVYDEAGHLLGEYSSTGALVQETIWLGDTPVATIRPKTGGVDIFYVHTDHLNTPRKITRPSDNKLRWRWDPTPFGTGTPNENPQSLGAFSYNLRFPGQYFDAESGLNYNYFRDYDSASGRYVQSDPIGLQGGINTYAYVDSNPAAFSDPKGLVPGGFPPRGIPRVCEKEDWKVCNDKCFPKQAVACSVSLVRRLKGLRNGNSIWAYDKRSVNCECEDDNVCKRSPAACILGGVVGLIGVCAAPEIVIPGLILGGSLGTASQ